MTPFPDRDARRFPALHDPSVRFLLGLFTLGSILVFAYDVEPLLTFRPVEAEVVGADVARLKLTGRRANTHVVYQSEVFYRYQVAGVQYMGRRYRRADLESSLRIARLRALEFTAGSRVRAWYNPFHPDEAVLSRSLNVELLAWTCFLLAFAWLGALTQRPRSAPARSASAPTE